jgi:hypothetical protein
LLKNWWETPMRACRERPRHRRTAEQRDEFPPSYSITSSARASRVDGTSSPSALAVVRSMVRSNLVGCARPLLSQHNRAALIEADYVERILADVDTHRGNGSV